jgi:hypothetical protein
VRPARARNIGDRERPDQLVDGHVLGRQRPPHQRVYPLDEVDGVQVVDQVGVGRLGVDDVGDDRVPQHLPRHDVADLLPGVDGALAAADDRDRTDQVEVELDVAGGGVDLDHALAQLLVVDGAGDLVGGVEERADQLRVALVQLVLELAVGLGVVLGELGVGGHVRP